MAGTAQSSNGNGNSATHDASTAVTLPTTDGEASSGVGEAIASSGVASTSTSTSTSTAAGGQAPKKLDPAVLDAILGKSDAQRMMEAVRDLKSDAYDHEQKMYIWDELEMVSWWRRKPRVRCLHEHDGQHKLTFHRDIASICIPPLHSRPARRKSR